MDDNGLIRSMSKKDVHQIIQHMKVFFERLKNEMFYNRNWDNVSINDFIDILNNYIEWYYKKRIKKSLGYKSPVEYRKELGLI